MFEKFCAELKDEISRIPYLPYTQPVRTACRSPPCLFSVFGFGSNTGSAKNRDSSKSLLRLEHKRPLAAASLRDSQDSEEFQQKARSRSEEVAHLFLGGGTRLFRSRSEGVCLTTLSFGHRFRTQDISSTKERRSKSATSGTALRGKRERPFSNSALFAETFKQSLCSPLSKKKKIPFHRTPKVLPDASLLIVYGLR